MILTRANYDIASVVNVYIGETLINRCFAIDTKRRLLTIDADEAKALGLEGEPLDVEGVSCVVVKANFQLTAKLSDISRYCHAHGVPELRMAEQATQANVFIQIQ